MAISERLSKWLGIEARREQQRARTIDDLAGDVLAGTLVDEEALAQAETIGLTPAELDQRVRELEQRAADKKILADEQKWQKKLAAIAARQKRDNATYEKALHNHRKATDVNEAERVGVEHKLRIIGEARLRLFATADSSAHDRAKTVKREVGKIGMRIGYIRQMLSTDRTHAMKPNDDGLTTEVRNIFAEREAWKAQKKRAPSQAVLYDRKLKEVDTKEAALRNELRDLEKELVEAEAASKGAQAELLTV